MPGCGATLQETPSPRNGNKGARRNVHLTTSPFLPLSALPRRGRRFPAPAFELSLAAPEFVPGQPWGSLAADSADALDAPDGEADELDFQFDEELAEEEVEDKGAASPRSRGSAASDHAQSPETAVAPEKKITFDAEECVPRPPLCCFVPFAAFPDLQSLCAFLVAAIPASNAGGLWHACAHVCARARFRATSSLDEREFADLDVDRVVVLVQRAVSCSLASPVVETRGFFHALGFPSPSFRSPIILCVRARRGCSSRVASVPCSQMERDHEREHRRRSSLSSVSSSSRIADSLVRLWPACPRASSRLCAQVQGGIAWPFSQAATPCPLNATGAKLAAAALLPERGSRQLQRQGLAAALRHAQAARTWRRARRPMPDARRPAGRPAENRRTACHRRAAHPCSFHP